MKAKRWISGVLAGVLLLACIPLAGLGLAEVDAARLTPDTMPDGITGWRLPGLTGQAESVQSATDAAANAVDGFLGTTWHSKYNETGTGGSGENIAVDENKNGFIRGNNFYITLRKSAEVSAIGYVPRSQSGAIDDPNGFIKTYKVYTTTDETISESTQWSEVTGAAGQDQSWTCLSKTAQDEYNFIFANPISGVRHVRIETLTSGGNAKNENISAAEFFVYGVEETDTEGYRLMYGLTGVADSQESDAYAASNALDGMEGTHWHSKHSGTDGKPQLPALGTDENKYNKYTISLRVKADIQKIGYVPQHRNDGTFISGSITQCEIWTSTDGGQTYKKASEPSNWTYNTSGKDNGTEKEVFLTQNQEGVTNIQIRVLSTQGAGTNNTNIYIHASEFRVYGKKSANQDTMIAAPSLRLTQPQAGQSVGAATALESDPNYSVVETKWFVSGSTEPVYTFSNYRKYDAQVTLEAKDRFVFDDTQLPKTVQRDESGTTVATNHCVITEAGKRLTFHVEYDNLIGSAALEKVYYPDKDGNFHFTQDDYDFFNTRENLTVTVLVRYDNTKIVNGRQYALFTLEGDQGEYYTVYHRPTGSQGQICYAFWNGSEDDSTKKISDTKWVYSKTQHHTTDGKWHKVYLSLKGAASGVNSKFTFGMDQDQGTNAYVYTQDIASNKTEWYHPCIFENVYTHAYAGQKAKKGTYSIGTMSDLGDAGEIGYISVSGTFYDNTADIQTEVAHNVMNGFKVEFNRVKSLLDSAKPEDYRPESWSEFEELKTSVNIDANTADTNLQREWLCADAISAMRTATDKLKVCHHFYKNDICKYCGRRKSETSIDAFQVTVMEDGTEDLNQKKTDVLFGACLSVTAKETKNGKKFQYWTNKENGNPISTKLTYDFYVTRDITLYAIYGERDRVEKPAITISNTYAKQIEGKNRVYFEVTRSVPTSYTVLEHGILLTTNREAATEEDMKINLDDGNFPSMHSKVKKFPGNDKAHRGVVNYDAAVGDHVNDKIYAVGYVITKDENGNVESAYTELVDVTYNGLLPNNNNSSTN